MRHKTSKMKSHDLPQSFPQGGDRAQDSEDRRILTIADELRRRCQLYEAELRDGESHVSSREAEELRQRLVKNARPATQVMIDTYMAALGFTKTDQKGHFTNGTYEAWDLLPRNVLVDKDGDLYVVDAELRKMK